MSESSRLPLPPAGRVLVGAVGLAGVVISLTSVTALARTDVPLQWVAFSLLTFLTGMFTLKLPSLDALLSISEVFAFSCVLLFGPEMGAITAGVDTLLLSWRSRHTPAQTLFNYGNLTLSVWASGKLFFASAALVTPRAVAPLFYEPTFSNELLVPLGLLAATYFLLNSGLTATVISIQERLSIVQTWRSHFLTLAPTYAAGASIALLLVVALRQVHLGAIVLVPPVLFIAYLTQRASFGRLEDSRQHVEKLNRMYLATIETLATAIDAKDDVTHGHIRRVQTGAMRLAAEIGVRDLETLKAIEAAALLHDTGKIAVPEHILNKPGSLTPAEFEKMKLHAPIGAEILSSIDFPYPVVPIVRHHHENWDGTGYPDGLRGTDIPLGARILSVVDCYDALTSDRPYRPRMTDDYGLQVLKDRRGTMYDPLIVDAFVAGHRRIMPPSADEHPAARVVGAARARSLDQPLHGSASAPRQRRDDEALGIRSLVRAATGEASAADIGVLCWTVLEQTLPCAAIGVFDYDRGTDTLTARYAAGTHASVIESLRSCPGQGIIGWVAANRRVARGADPALDFGNGMRDLSPPLLSCMAAPMIDEGTLRGVVAVYATVSRAFTEEDARLFEASVSHLARAFACVNHTRERRRRAAGELAYS